MSTLITVKTRIRVNGKDYGNVEDMPADVRQAYERALSAIESGKPNAIVKISSPTANAQMVANSTIVFNGQEYPGVEQMPADVRRLYDAVVATLETDRTPGASATARTEAGQSQWQGAESRLTARAAAMTAGAVRPESTTSRWIIAGAVIAALLLGSYVFGC